MPESYGLQAPSREQGMLAWSEVSGRMAGARNYWVGTTRPDGRPHVAPVWGVWLDEAFFFSTDLMSRKGRNIAANPEMLVHLESGDDVVILEGTAEEVLDRSLLQQFADVYEAKYQFRPGVESERPGVFRLRTRAAFAWLEKDFPRTATRWRFGRE